VSATAPRRVSHVRNTPKFSDVGLLRSLIKAGQLDAPDLEALAPALEEGIRVVKTVHLKAS
jgi:hypothetical protein